MQQNIHEMAGTIRLWHLIEANVACESAFSRDTDEGRGGKKLIKGQKSVAAVDNV